MNRNSNTRPRRPEPGLAHKIGAKILAGRYRVGDLLAREQEARSDHNVSRGVYRESLRTLAAKGLVRSRTNVGTVITDPSHWTLLDPEVLQWIQAAGKTDPRALDLLELCRSMEPVAASLAAARRRHADTVALREAFASLAEHTIVSEASRHAEFRLHSALLKSTRNSFFVSLAAASHAAIALHFPAHGELQDVRLHRRLVEAICDRKPQAATRSAERLWLQTTST